MSSAVSRPPLPTGGPSAGGDEFDDLNDYDIELDDPTDPFGNNYQVSQDKTAPKTSEREKGKGGDGLGLDEEVEVTRKARAPRVKLDEHRLLSAAGIPKLRKKAREHLKFKGKGHEVYFLPFSSLNPSLFRSFLLT
jgi:replication fork protection complex subunit Csm3/Swi3